MPVGVGDFLQDRLQPLLELTAEFRARDQRAQVEGDHPLVLEVLRHVAAHDALRQPLGDRRLADARLADQHRVVLRPPRKDLHHPPDLFVATDHRVELALSRQLREVAPVLLERLVLVLRVWVGHALPSANLGERLVDAVFRHAETGQQLCRPGVGPVENAEQQMLGADVLVTHPLRFVLRLLQNLAQAVAGRRLRGVGELRQILEFGCHIPAYGSRIDAELPQGLGNQAVRLIEESEKQRDRLELGDVARFSLALRVEIASCAFSVNFVVLAILLSLFVGAHPRLTSMQMHYFIQKHNAGWLAARCGAPSPAPNAGPLHQFTHQPRQGLRVCGSQMGHQRIEIGPHSLERRVVPSSGLFTEPPLHGPQVMGQLEHQLHAGQVEPLAFSHQVLHLAQSLEIVVQ